MILKCSASFLVAFYNHSFFIVNLQSFRQWKSRGKNEWISSVIVVRLISSLNLKFPLSFSFGKFSVAIEFRENVNKKPKSLTFPCQSTFSMLPKTFFSHFFIPHPSFDDDFHPPSNCWIVFIFLNEAQEETRYISKIISEMKFSFIWYFCMLKHKKNSPFREW